MCGNIAEAFLDGEFLDFGGPLVRSGSLVVAMPQAAMRLLVTGVGALSMLRGILGVAVGDGLSRGESRLSAKKFVGPVAGLIAR